jgi:hypothetical protein
MFVFFAMLVAAIQISAADIVRAQPILADDRPERTHLISSRDTKTLAEMKANEEKVFGLLLQRYEFTDWSDPVAMMRADTASNNNPNVAIALVSMSNAFLSRYEATGNAADFEKAVVYAEWMLANHELWGGKWLTGFVVGYLDITFVRLQAHCETTEVYGGRLDAAYKSALEITKSEADLRLAGGGSYGNLPYLPLDSSVTGDTKAEEDGWEAMIFSVAANLIPNDSNASAWDRKARQLAYDAITRPSDPADAEGVKTTTVPEDFMLANHGFFPNPTYTAATIFILGSGSLGYSLTGHQVPEEFIHNVGGLYATYKSKMVGEDLNWTYVSDPEGDATMFPLGNVGDISFESAAAAAKASRETLWHSSEPVAKLGMGADLWEAVMDGKIVSFYLMGSYLIHFPPQQCGQ